MLKYSGQTHKKICEQPLCKNRKRKEPLKTKVPISA